jgi:hypothetical protein
MTDLGGSVEDHWCLCIISFIIHFLISRKHREQAIAVHTFLVLVRRWSTPTNYISKRVVLTIWLFAAFDIGISNIVHRKEKYYGNTGYCKLCIFLRNFGSRQANRFPLKGAG